jgi:hypothetical protein
MKAAALATMAVTAVWLVTGCASQPAEEGADLEEIEREAEEAQGELERETRD